MTFKNSILQVFTGTCKVDFVEKAAQNVYSQKIVMEVFLNQFIFRNPQKPLPFC